MHRPLAAETETVSSFLSDRGKIAVDGPRALIAASHRGDQNRRLHRLADQSRGQIDVGDAHLRKRVVHEADTLE